MEMTTSSPLNLPLDQAFTIIGVGRTKGWTHVKLGHIHVTYFGRNPKISTEEITRIAREGLPRITKPEPKAVTKASARPRSKATSKAKAK